VVYTNSTDVNGDGKPDIIAGDIGNNIQIHFSEKEPSLGIILLRISMVTDPIGSPFLNCYVEGKKNFMQG